MYRSDRDQTDPPPTRSPSYAIAWLAEHAVPVAYGGYVACVLVLVCSLGSMGASIGLSIHGCVAIAQRLNLAHDESAGREPGKSEAALLAISWIVLPVLVIIAVVRFAWLTAP